MVFEMVNKTRTAEAEITEVLSEGEVVGTVILLYMPHTLEGFSQINTKLLEKLAAESEDDKDNLLGFEGDEEPENQDEMFDVLETNDYILETEEFITSYIRNQAAAADKKVIQVKHCYGSWEEKEQLEFTDDAIEFPEVDDNILSQFLEAEVNDVKITKSTKNFKLGNLIYKIEDETYKVGQVSINSRGTTNRVRIDFWSKPTKEITFYAAAFLVTLRGRVPGGRVDYYYNNERIKSAIIPTP